MATINHKNSIAKIQIADENLGRLFISSSLKKVILMVTHGDFSKILPPKTVENYVDNSGWFNIRPITGVLHYSGQSSFKNNDVLELDSIT